MVSTLTSSKLESGEQRVVFNNLTWAQYQQILTALPRSRSARLTYALGTLEISMPLEAHEHASEMFGVFVRALVMLSGLKLKSIGSTTLDKEDLDRGAEPDKAYYIQNQSSVADKTIDLECDPPPDLVVEVDITHTDIDKNRLYAALGIPEFWRYNGREWRIFQLVGDRYQAVNNSPTFSIVEKSELYSFLEKAKQDEIEAELWLKAHIQQKLS